MRDQRQPPNLGLVPVHKAPPGSAHTMGAAHKPFDTGPGPPYGKSPPRTAPTSNPTISGRNVPSRSSVRRFQYNPKGGAGNPVTGLPLEFAVPATPPKHALHWSQKKISGTGVFSFRSGAPPSATEPASPVASAMAPRDTTMADLFKERPSESVLQTGNRRGGLSTPALRSSLMSPQTRVRTADGIWAQKPDGIQAPLTPSSRQRRASFTAGPTPKAHRALFDDNSAKQPALDELSPKRPIKPVKQLRVTTDTGDGDLASKHVGFKAKHSSTSKTLFGKDKGSGEKPSFRIERSSKSEGGGKLLDRNAALGTWERNMSRASNSSEDTASEDSGDSRAEEKSRGRTMRTFEEAQKLALDDLETRGAAAIRGQVQEGAVLGSAISRAVTGEPSLWGVGASDPKGGQQASPPALTEAIREDLNHRLACAHDTGFLNLTYNQWPELPDQVASFLKHQGRYLKSLNLEGNQIMALPDVMDRMGMLVSLNLGGNQLVGVPDSAQKLQCLTTLCLEKNQLSVLPDTLAECQALTYLDLSHNKIMWLPDTLKSLKKLITLKVCHNKMCHLPEQICEMTSLREINASHNTITGIPPELGKLNRLEALHLNHNKLTALPAALGALWRSLVELDVRHNSLSVLPSSLAACKKLDVLELGSNPLVMPPLEVVQQGIAPVLKFLSSAIGNDNRNGQLRMASRNKGPSQSSVSKRNLALLVNQVTTDISPPSPRADPDGGTPGPSTECGSCVQLHKEIGEWKQEIRTLMAQVEENEEEIEGLQQDGKELRENMMRKQNRLREMEEALQTVARERDQAKKEVESGKQELQEHLVANSDAMDMASGLQSRLEELEGQKAELEVKLTNAEARVAAVTGELEVAHANSATKELQQLKERVAGAEKAREEAHAARAAAQQEAAAREAELLARIRQLEHDAALSKEQKPKQTVLKSGTQMNFDSLNGASGQKKAGRRSREA